MKSIFSVICYFLIVIFLIGCVLGNDSKKIEDKGSFEISISPLQFKSYPAGGGLVLISLEPNTDFAGDVDLLFETDENITLIPDKSVLSMDKMVEEIEVYPDTTATPGEYWISIIYQHAGIIDTKTVQIIITDLPDPFIRHIGFNKILSAEIVQWLDETHPEYGIKTDDSWFCFCEDVETLGLIWRYINQSWDIKIEGMAYPPLFKWYLLRKRGCIEPLLCVKKDKQGLFEEIPVNDFGKNNL